MKPQVFRLTAEDGNVSQSQMVQLPTQVAVAIRFVDQIQGQVLCPVMQSNTESLGTVDVNVRVFRDLTYHERATYESALNVLEAYFNSCKPVVFHSPKGV